MLLNGGKTRQRGEPHRTYDFVELARGPLSEPCVFSNFA